MATSKKAPLIKSKSKPKKVKITLAHLHEHLLLITSQLSLILKKQNKVMASQQDALNKVQELSDKVDSLQATVDSEQADIQALLATNAQVVTDLNAQIAALQAIIDAGGGADTQPIIDAMQAVVSKVEAASADVASTV